MKKNGKILIIICLSILIICVFCIISIIYGICNYNTTIFKNQYYDSVEELHDDYLLELEEAYNNGDSMTDYYPKKIVNYFEEGKNVYVICTYSSLFEADVNTSALLVYILNKNEKGYYLEIPYYGVSAIYSAIIPLHDDYENSDYKKNYMEYKNKNSKICYGFAYKSYSENYNLLFDGNIMEEIEFTNPFTKEQFMLCYGTSNKVYNIIEMLFTPLNERHSLTVY